MVTTVHGEHGHLAQRLAVVESPHVDAVVPTHYLSMMAKIARRLDLRKKHKNVLLNHVQVLF